MNTDVMLMILREFDKGSWVVYYRIVTYYPGFKREDYLTVSTSSRRVH